MGGIHGGIHGRGAGMNKTRYVLTIENRLGQRITERYDHTPCILEIMEAVNMAKYALDNPFLTRLELTKGADNDNGR